MRAWVGAEVGGRRSGACRASAIRTCSVHPPGRLVMARPPAGASVDAPPARRLVARHCWVTGPPGTPGRWPGIVLEWRQSEGRWEGRVVVVVLTGSDPKVVCSWFDQDYLAPAD